MDGHNLIPHARIHARHARRRLLRWAIMLSGFTALVAAGVTTSQVALRVDRGDADRRIADLTNQVELVDARIQRLRSELADAGRELRRTRMVGRHPDWSVLLVLLARLSGDDLMLRRISLDPIPDQQGYTIGLDGVAVSQAEVSSFVLALERSGMFTGTRLEATKRETIASTEAVAFDLSARIEPDSGAIASAEAKP